VSAGLNLARLRAICFDIDGTLADTDDAMVLRLAGWLRPLARLTPGRDLPRLARRLVMATEGPANLAYALADRLYLDELAAPFLDALHRVRGEGRPSRFLLIPGIQEALAALRQRYPLALVSARDRRSVEAFLDQFGLASLFGCVATARTCHRTKPHPAAVLWTAVQLGLPPEGLLMVGDTTVDIRAGRAAGTQTVGVLCGFGDRRDLQGAGADVILESTVDLPELLLQV
jgi:phosphoglycolate phosphatase-like HAD superfamily hydrolase